MGFSIDYVVLCSKGKVRTQNQDNFWCQGHYLDHKNAGLKEGIAGSVDFGKWPAFAVFDGMGGESQGEMAAYIAAKAFDACYPLMHAGSSKSFLSSVFIKMNEDICDYNDKSNVIGHMGSTAALLLFSGNKAYIGNIGDSKIFLYRGGILRQISQDHTANMAQYAKPPLSQHLGIPQEEFVIAPYITSFTCKHNDLYLLCSDGLTDVVSLNDMEKIIRAGKDVQGRADELMRLAMVGGGIDNTTIIMCELRKTRWNLNLA